jgi:hypothetical protein
MPASFPQTTRHFIVKQDDVDYVYADDINALQDEVFAIESVFGLLPQGDEATVADRLALIETTTLRLTGTQTVAGAKTFSDPVTFAGGWLVSDLVALGLSGNMAAQIGAATDINLAFDHTGVQARNNGGTAPLRLNPLGGLVHVGGDGLTSDGDVEVAGALTAAGLVTLLADLVADGDVTAAGTGTFNFLVTPRGTIGPRGTNQVGGYLGFQGTDGINNFGYAIRQNGDAIELVDGGRGAYSNPATPAMMTLSSSGGYAFDKPLNPTTRAEVGGTSSVDFNSLASALHGAWVAVSGPYYLMDAAGVVHIEGAVESGTGLILTIPAHVRPRHPFYLTCTGPSANDFHVHFDTDGTVTALDYPGSSTANLYLHTSYWVGGGE